MLLGQVPRRQKGSWVWPFQGSPLENRYRTKPFPNTTRDQVLCLRSTHKLTAAPPVPTGGQDMALLLSSLTHGRQEHHKPSSEQLCPTLPQPGRRTYLLLLLLLNVSRAVCWQLPFCRPLFAFLFFPTLFFWERETKVSWELREGTRSGGSSPLRGGRPWCVSGRIQTPAVPRGEGRAPPQG